MSEIPSERAQSKQTGNGKPEGEHYRTIKPAQNKQKQLVYHYKQIQAPDNESGLHMTMYPSKVHANQIC